MRRFRFVLPCWMLCSFVSASAACHTPQTIGHSVIDHYVTDRMLHRRWAVLVDCAHPERPWQMQEVGGQDSIAKGIPHPGALLVRNGSSVEVWHMSGSAQVRLRGVALEDGAAGQTIRVRLPHPSTVLTGRVRGAGSVELVTSGKWESQ